jgi:hypothetical protein
MNNPDDLAKLAQQLPPLGARVQNLNPLIRARLYVPGSRRAWYLVAAGEYNGEIVFFGTERECHFAPQVRTWRHFTISFFIRVGSALGQPIAIDDAFQPCLYTELVG